jgi:type I restriction enzyme S subunit
MKSYPEYKDSGIEWLGEVPEHWSLRKLKYAVTLTKEDAEERHEDFQIALENIESWTGQFIETDSEYSGSGDAFEEGDILFNKLRPYLAKVFHAQRAGTPVGELLVLRPEPDVSSRFLFYRLLSAEFIDVVDGSTYGAKMPRASWDFIGDLKIPIPPLEEQRTIAAYLDRKTAQIDTLIAKKQRLIDLLQEQRTAVINRAVTQGLDPDAPMQDSGIEWLGEVPAHWDQVPLKYAVHEIIDAEHKTAPYHDDGDYLVARTTNIRDGALTLEDAEYTDQEGFDEWTRRGVPQPGDILFTREAPAGEACIVPDDVPLCLGQRVVLLRVDHDVLDERFGLWSLYSRVAWDYIKASSQGSTVDHINMSDIRNIPTLLPPVSEQEEVAAYIEKKTGELESIIDREVELIEKLEELRTSLISEVVTGKIDVRDDVPQRTEVAA